ncbi:MAG TPA: tetratricopeptide repeat protein, partial [Myxococcota bacterium]|nr:tetratricopeptide repeat protein [Myxococcota bacterium]
MIQRSRRLLAGALVAVCTSGALVGCSSDAQRRARHQARAESFLEEGKPREALIELRSALKLDPKNSPLHFRIAQVFEGIGDLKEALFFYQEALRLAPEENAAALAIARLLLFDEPDRAAELIEGVLARHPDDANAYIRRSELALARGNTADALRDARLAVEKAPKSHMPHFQEGLVHRARVRERKLLRQPEDPQIFAEALKAFDEGLAVAPADAPVNEVVSGALERAYVFSEWVERRAEAGPAYRRALELAKEGQSLVEQLRVLREAQSYAQRVGDKELEHWALDTQIALDPRSYAAWARLAGLEPGDAVPKRLIETLPDDGRAHSLYARILWDRGREDEALAHLREVEGRVADPVPLRAAQAELLIEGERLDDARPLVEALEREQPERPETLDVASFLAMRERRYADAAGLLRKLIERRETARAQHRLAESEFRMRSYAPSLVAVNRALDLVGNEDERMQMLRLKARIEAASRDPEAALLTMRRLRRLRGGTLRPDDVPTLARALYATKRSDVARIVLREAIASETAVLGSFLLYLRHEA